MVLPSEQQSKWLSKRRNATGAALTVQNGHSQIFMAKGHTNTVGWIAGPTCENKNKHNT